MSKPASSGGKASAGQRLKKAQTEGRTIVFIDESGLSQRPHRCRTWAPRGRTPLLQYHFNWKTISVAAGMTWWNFHFQIFEKSIGKEEVVEFLMHLLQHLSGPLLIIWDRLPAHRSRLVAEFVRCLEGEIEIEYLPAYAPELNPVEYLWGPTEEGSRAGRYTGVVPPCRNGPSLVHRPDAEEEEPM